MHSKAHTTLTAPLVLHCTRIHKCAMKKFGINSQMGSKLFLIVIYHFSLVKATVNAAHVCKLHNGVKKTISSFFDCQRRNKDQSALVNCGGVEFLKLRWAQLVLEISKRKKKCSMNILRSYLNCCIIGN
jgi:hypothetical protein